MAAVCSPIMIMLFAFGLFGFGAGAAAAASFTVVSLIVFLLFESACYLISFPSYIFLDLIIRISKLFQDLLRVASHIP